MSSGTKSLVVKTRGFAAGTPAAAQAAGHPSSGHMRGCHVLEEHQHLRLDLHLPYTTPHTYSATQHRRLASSSPATSSRASSHERFVTAQPAAAASARQPLLTFTLRYVCLLSGEVGCLFALSRPCTDTAATQIPSTYQACRVESEKRPKSPRTMTACRHPPPPPHPSRTDSSLPTATSREQEPAPHKADLSPSPASSRPCPPMTCGSSFKTSATRTRSSSKSS